MTCGKPTEVYSRVCGYHRPVNNWNKGKQEEFRQLVRKKALGTLDCWESEMLDELQKQREIKAFKKKVAK
jgi:hypothetical protein